MFRTADLEWKSRRIETLPHLSTRPLPSARGMQKYWRDVSHSAEHPSSFLGKCQSHALLPGW